MVNYFSTECIIYLLIFAHIDKFECKSVVYEDGNSARIIIPYNYNSRLIHGVVMRSYALKCALFIAR